MDQTRIKDQPSIVPDINARAYTVYKQHILAQTAKGDQHAVAAARLVPAVATIKVQPYYRSPPSGWK